jgi:hypothetical protein
MAIWEDAFSSGSESLQVRQEMAHHNLMSAVAYYLEMHRGHRLDDRALAELEMERDRLSRRYDEEMGMREETTRES